MAIAETRCLRCGGTGLDDADFPTVEEVRAGTHVWPICIYCSGTGGMPVPFSEVRP